ncbi:MAG: tetratricopeptide repeat protein [Myxococcota bacterium]
MQIVCDQCRAQYEIDPPAAPFVRDQDLVFRCTACGNSILVKPGGDDSAEPAASQEPDTGAATPQETRSILLRQEGKTYHVKDQATLQRWIVERRILREDEISMGGQEWKTVGDFEGFHVFFELIDKADRSAEEAVEATDVVPSKVDLFAAPPTGVIPESLGDSAQGLGRPIRLAVEAIPEEEPASLLPDNSSIGPDEPTMDMNFEEEDFFSEEQTVLDGGGSFSTANTLDSGDDDDFGPEFEWAASRRKRVLVWWALCFSALGGTGWLALNYLNQRDAVLEKNAVVDVQPVLPDAVVEPDAAKADGADSGAAPEPEVKAEAEKEPPAEKVAVEASTPKAPPKPKAATDKPSVKKKAKASGAKPERTRSSGNAKAETNRGWAYADREDWAKARNHFNNAVKASPGHADARFGLAYVNEKQGRVEEAVRQYCRLRATASGDAKIEASGRIDALGRKCP